MINRSIRFVLVVLSLSACTYAVDARFDYVGTGAGFEAGLVIPNHLTPMPVVGGILNFSFDMGDIGDFAIRPNMELWFSGDDNWYKDRSADVFVTDFTFNGDFRYYFPLPGNVPVRPFIGNGMGFEISAISYEFDNNTDDSETDVDPLFNFHTGIAFDMASNIEGSVEFKFTNANFSCLKLLFGMVFEL